MQSILIKDTTREQREQIVRDSLGDDLATRLMIYYMQEVKSYGKLKKRA